MTNNLNNITQSVHLRLKKELLKEIDEFTESYHFTNRTDAMRFLIGLGLRYQKKSSKLMDDKTLE